ncbi:hypothetical protein EMIT0P12_50162 [Pseudomonas sp. IT-P12]
MTTKVEPGPIIEKGYQIDSLLFFEDGLTSFQTSETRGIFHARATSTGLTESAAPITPATLGRP